METLFKEARRLSVLTLMSVVWAHTSVVWAQPPTGDNIVLIDFHEQNELSDRKFGWNLFNKTTVNSSIDLVDIRR